MKLLPIAIVVVVIAALAFAFTQHKANQSMLTSASPQAQASPVSLTKGNSDPELNQDSDNVDKDMDNIVNSSTELDKSLNQTNLDNETNITE